MEEGGSGSRVTGLPVRPGGKGTQAKVGWQGTQAFCGEDRASPRINRQPWRVLGRTRTCLDASFRVQWDSEEKGKQEGTGGDSTFIQISLWPGRSHRGRVGRRQRKRKDHQHLRSHTDNPWLGYGGAADSGTLELGSLPKARFPVPSQGAPGDRGVTCAWGAGGLSRALADSPFCLKSTPTPHSTPNSAF